VNEGRFLDLIEIDAASNTSVEDVRDLRDKINFSPNQARYNVYIIDEVHILSTAAFNALLKTLEEPPAHAMFILATTEVHRIPATVLSRCQRHEFRRIPVVEIVALLERIAQDEGIQVEPEALTLVARQATGSMRDAISLLDQLASTGKTVTLEMAQSILGTATSQAVLDVWEALLASDSTAGLQCIHRALDGGSDPRQFARQMVEYMRSLLMVRMGNADQVDASPEVRAQMARHAHSIEVLELLRIIQAFNRAAVEARASWMPALPLEMAFIESLEKPQPASSPTAIPPEPPRHATRSPGKPAPKVITPEPAQSDSPGSPEPNEPSIPVDPTEARRFNELWHQLLEAIRKANPNLYGLVNSAKTRRLVNGILTLGFSGDVLKEKMEKGENIQSAQAIISQIFGETVVIRCEALTGRQSSPPPGVDNDGMVASALRDLGGEIVDIH